MRARVRRIFADDTGASLVLVLALMIFSSLVVGTLLTYTGTSLRSTQVTEDLARDVYDTDGALQAAINNVREGTYNNVSPGPSCNQSGLGSAAGLNFPGPNLSQTVRVICEPAPGTGGGATSEVPINDSNRPASAVLTLGTGGGGETGIRKTSTGILRISGQVYSNSNIDASAGGSIDVAGAPAIARGACTGTINSTPAVSCSDTSPNPDSADPGYAQPSAGLTWQPVPACPATAGATVKFSPGYYDDAVGLTSLMSSCTGRTFWFQPGSGGTLGRYYFDFHNGEGGGLPSTGSDVWTIGNSAVRMVAGAASGWNPDASPRQIPAIPGSCVSPMSSTTSGGVQFIFGGKSRLVVTAGQVEVCGKYATNQPPIAIYGAKSGADVTSGPTAFNPSASANSPAPAVAFNNPSNIWGAGAADATLVTASGQTKTATITLSGFLGGTNIPAGSILTDARVLVTARETNSQLNLFTATARPNPARPGAALSAVSITESYPNYPASPWTSGNLASAAFINEVHRYGLTDMSVQINARVPQRSNVRVDLDLVQIRLTWKPPAVRGEQTLVGGSNCVGATPYPGGTRCALIQASGSGTRLFIQGTAYAPLAALDLTLTNGSQFSVATGLIARKLEVSAPATQSYLDPIFIVPPNSAGRVALQVYFRAYSCPQGETCSGDPPAAPWRLAGTTLVSYTDAGANPVAGDRDVGIMSWTIYR